MPTSFPPVATALATRADDDIAADTVSIRPQVGMYGAFARLGYTPWHAIAELVDNAVQSYLSASSGRAMPPLEVRVRLEHDLITVSDNAGGIDFSDFPRVFSPAEPPPNALGLSEFGIGLKAAASWLAERWEVRTKVAGDAIERTVRFDVSKIVSERIERLPIATRSLSADKLDAHYTEVRLEGLSLRLRGRTIGKIKRHLASIYRQYLRRGVLRLHVDTGTSHETLSYVEPAILEAPYYRTPDGPSIEWKKAIKLDFGEGRRVHGWVALLAKGDTSLAGLALLRRDRLILGSDDVPYRPRDIYRSDNKFTSQRLFGELSVEGFSVSHTKDGIQWGPIEEDVLEALRAQINSDPLPMLRQAEGHRVRTPASSLPPDYGAGAIRRTGRSLELHGPAVIDAQLASPPAAAPPGALPDDPTTSSFDGVCLRICQGRRHWNIRFQTVREPTAELCSYAYSPGETHETVTIRINFADPFAERFLNDDESTVAVATRFVAALVISEITARDAGVRNAGTIRRNMNQLLRDVFSAADDGKEG